MQVFHPTVSLPLSSLAPGLQPSYSPLAKSKFSMVLPQVEKSLNEWGTRSIILLGIEVSSFICPTSARITHPNYF